MQLPPSQVSPGEAESTARSVLSGRKYLEAARPPSLRERALDWISDAIGDLLEALSSGGGRGFVAWIVVGLFLALIVFLLSRLLGGAPPIPRRRTAEGPDIELFSGRSADEWRAAAIEAEAAGDFRTGLRCRHRALVVDLIDAGAIEVRPGMTARAIARRTDAALPSAGAAMHEATDVFEGVWYGMRTADAAARDAFLASAERVVAAAAAVDRTSEAVPV